MTRLSLRAGVVAFSLAVVALPGTAFAGSITHSDPAKDVQKVPTTGENNLTLSKRLHL